MARVLLYYASIGTGHLSAARSVQSALLKIDPGTQVQIADIFGRTSLRTGWLDTLSGLVHLAVPRLYTWVWRTGSMMAAFQLSRRMPWFTRRVSRQIEQFRPDCIVFTHALPCAIAANLPGFHGQVPLVAVATDYDVHPYWLAKQVRAFVAAGEAGQATLFTRGIDPSCIYPYGIPIRPEIAGIPRRPLDDGLSVLVMAVGGQIGPYLPIQLTITALLRQLAARELPGVRWQFIFGANKAFLRRAQKLLADRPGIELCGYVDDLPDRLASAHLVLTKPGGSTLAEACALGTPALLLTPGAGQEWANAQVLLKVGAARLAVRADDILAQIRQFQNDPSRLQQMAQNSAALGRPDAALKIARLVLSLAGERL